MIPPFIARLLGDTTLPIGPRIDDLERAAAEENEGARIRHARQEDTAHGAPRRTPDVITVEPIKAGDALDLFNRAYQGCERCDGMGRVSVVGTDGLRDWVECDCIRPIGAG